MGDPPKFDHQKAKALVDKLTDAIRMLQRQTGDRSTRAQTMRKSWKGPYADQFFNTEMPLTRKDAQTLVGQMQALITQVNSAAQAADDATATWWRSQPTPSPAPGPAPTPPTAGP